VVIGTPNTTSSDATQRRHRFVFTTITSVNLHPQIIATSTKSLIPKSHGNKYNTPLPPLPNTHQCTAAGVAPIIIIAAAAALLLLCTLHTKNNSNPQSNGTNEWQMQ
jgi:hypothetical protein